MGAVKPHSLAGQHKPVGLIFGGPEDHNKFGLRLWGIHRVEKHP